MKMIVVFFTALALISWGCGSDAKRYPVQGKWKIEQVMYQREGKPDSVVTSGLGFLLFHECLQDSNSRETCTAERIHANGKVEKFNYGTQLQRHADGNTKNLLMAQFARKSGDNEMEDFRGRFVIDRLSDQEMAVSCTNCDVGRMEDRLERFELRATKVPE